MYAISAIVLILFVLIVAGLIIGAMSETPNIDIEVDEEELL